MTPQEELRVLLAMILCGAALGVVYDGLWLLRKAFFPGGAALAIADLLYGPICAVGMIAAAFLLRMDAFRLYILGGVLCGMALQRISVGAFLRLVIVRAKNLAKMNGK